MTSATRAYAHRLCSGQYRRPGPPPATRGSQGSRLPAHLRGESLRCRRDRPQLARLLARLLEQDVVVVGRLDRLGRPTRDLLELAEQLRKAGAGLRSLGEPWADTTSPAGQRVLPVFAGIAEFERALIQEHTGAGTAAARQCGERFRRPGKLSAEKVTLAQRLPEEGTFAAEVARVLNAHRATLYRALGA